MGGHGKCLESRALEVMVFGKGSSSLGLGMLKAVNVPLCLQDRMQPSPWSIHPHSQGGIPKMVVIAPGVQPLASLLPPSPPAEPQPRLTAQKQPRSGECPFL